MERKYFVARTIVLVIIISACICVYNGRVKVPTEEPQIIQEVVEETISSPESTEEPQSTQEVVDKIEEITPSPEPTEEPQPTQEVVEEPTSSPEPTEEPQSTQEVVDDKSYDWSSDDSYLLAKIAMAEAEGEDTKGKALVIMTILNRVLSDEFPDTIHDVIYQPLQFSPISNGRFDRVEPSEDCYKALDMVQLDKWDESYGALYFESNRCADNWHSRNLDYLFTHGCHRFYK